MTELNEAARFSRNDLNNEYFYDFLLYSSKIRQEYDNKILELTYFDWFIFNRTNKCNNYFVHFIDMIT